jgi:hypothetical protein
MYRTMDSSERFLSLNYIDKDSQRKRHECVLLMWQAQTDRWSGSVDRIEVEKGLYP